MRRSDPPKRGWLLGLLAGLLLVAGAGAGFYFISDSSVDTTAASDGSGDEAADADSSGGTGAGDAASDSGAGAAADAASGGDGGEAAGEADGEAGDPPGGPAVENSDGSIRHTRLEGGKVYLEGRVPDQETKDAYYDATAAVTEPENIVNNLVVDPTAPANINGYPIFVADQILFEFNSAQLAPEFHGILDGMTKFLVLNESLTITIEAHTDSVGSAEANLELATERAESVRNYMINAGGDPARLFLLPLGETEAMDNQTDDQAAASRRVEFQLDRIEPAAAEGDEEPE